MSLVRAQVGQPFLIIMNNVVLPSMLKADEFRRPVFDANAVDTATLACELALTNIGDFEPLDIKIDCSRFKREIEMFSREWVDYLPKQDRVNNRKGLTLTNLPGKTHRDNPSFGQACYDAGRALSENDFNVPTEVYNHCESLHPLLDLFSPLGRSFLVQCNLGGYFVPHRDHPNIPRESFRIVVFLNNCAPMEYDWIMGADTKLQIEMGRAYYVNTRKTHRTISWVNNSIHMILNVPVNSGNVAKVLSHLQHKH